MQINRAFLLILDSFGIGALPDAADFGDTGANTLGSLCKAEGFSLPNLARLGLFNIERTPGESVPDPAGCYGRMAEQSRGKDTTIGHWELAGIVSQEPLPVYPGGFPPEVIAAFEEKTGRKTLCNLPYSGTKVLEDYGPAHLQSGALIVYTSADSVFQIAAHEELVPPEELYAYCGIARSILQGPHGVGRVIARPFTGSPGHFTRTANRHDFSLEPPAQTVLDLLADKGLAVIGVGKISDIFAGRSITQSHPTKGNEDGLAKLSALQREEFRGLCFINLVDFDMVYGHRRDLPGYARAMMRFDAALGDFLARMRTGDLLLITADHGCDPGFGGTDHTREYVPLLACGPRLCRATPLGTRASFADVAKTLAQAFEAENTLPGESFAQTLGITAGREGMRQ